MPLHKLDRNLEVMDQYAKVKSKKHGVISDVYVPNQQKFNNQVDQITPDIAGWRQFIAMNQSATTDLMGTRIKVSSVRGYHTIVINYGVTLPPSDPGNDTYTCDWQGPLLQGSVPDYQNFASAILAESRASELFFRKAQDALSSFQGGVFIAELGKAIRGIRNPALALKTYLGDHALRAKARRRNLLRDKRRLRAGNSTRTGDFGMGLDKAISDLWLESAYAWKPLVADLEGAAESLARLSSLEDSKIVSAEGFDDWASDGPIVTLSSPDGYHGIRFRRRNIESAKCRFYGKVVAYNDLAPGSFAGFLSRRLGLNLAQALPTAWELVPFSFVADYFSNLGGMISAYSFPLSAIRWVNRATMKRARMICTEPSFVHSPNSPSQTYEYQVENPGSYTATKDQFVRSAFNPGNILPSLRLTVPGVDGWPKWLNLAALANSIRQ
jgi:hypothetical protein